MLLKYFFEIKNRILLICFSWIVTLVISYLDKEVLLFIFIKPTLFLFKNSSFYFIATSLTDIFSTYLDLIYLIAISLTSIFLCYQMLTFFFPALYVAEIKTIKFYGFLSLTLWLLGLQLLNNVILPFTWYFFSSFQNSSINGVNIFLETRINDYLSFYTFLYWGLTFFSQLFLLFSFVLNMLEEKLEFIKNTRKIFYLIFLLIATVVTPPDILSQVFVSVGLGLIYELLIIITILKSKI